MFCLFVEPKLEKPYILSTEKTFYNITKIIIIAFWIIYKQ